MAYPTTSFDFRDPMLGELDTGNFYYPAAALAPQWQPPLPPVYDEPHFDPFPTWATSTAFSAPALAASYQPQLPTALNVIPPVSVNSTFDLKGATSNLTSAFHPRDLLPPAPPAPSHSSLPRPVDPSSNKLFRCSKCGKEYCRKSTLKAHIKHHIGERPFICQICGKTFSQMANLTAHRRVHTGEKPFSCSICLRPFSQSSSLVTHKRTHTGERPYPCNHCDKAFTDSSTLTKHLRTHTGQKPYECPLCMMRFSQSGNLHRHLKTHRIDADVKR